MNALKEGERVKSLLEEYQIAHVGFVVEDRQKAMERFGELYGIDNWQMVEWRPQKYVYKGRELKDVYVKIAISLPAEGTRIEILEPVTEGLHKDIQSSGDQTINHICHVVKDFDEALERFLSAGCELILETEYTDTIRGFRRCHYVYHPEWNTYVEIAEIPYFRKAGNAGERTDRAEGGTEAGAAKANGLPPAVPSLLQKIPFSHVGYVVKDRETVCEALSTIYGLEKWTMVEYKPLKAKCFGKNQDDYYVKAAVHPDIGGCGLEVIQPVSEGMHMHFFQKDPNSVNHVCHTVKDYEYWLQTFIDKGCELIFEAEMEDEIRGYRRCGYAYDPTLRTIFEFAEIPHFRNTNV